MLSPFGDTVVVVAKPLLEIGCHTDVEATFDILDDIDPCHAGPPKKWLRGRDLNPRSGSRRIMSLTEALSRSSGKSHYRGLDA